MTFAGLDCEGSAGMGGGSGSLTINEEESASITAAWVVGMEKLYTTDASLTITADCYTTPDEAWGASGDITINGGYTGGGSGATYGLVLGSAADVTVTDGVDAEAGAYAEAGIQFNSGGTLTADVTAEADSYCLAAVLFSGGGAIVGDVAANSGGADCAIEFAGGGTITGDVAVTVPGYGYGVVFSSGGGVIGVIEATGAASATPIQGTPSGGSVHVLARCDGTDITPYLEDGDLPAPADVEAGVQFGHDDQLTGTLPPPKLLVA